MQEHPYLTRDDFPSYNDEFAKLYQQLHPDKVPENEDTFCKSATFYSDRILQSGLYILL